MKRFEGKNVVITGAAAGIGQATAQRVAEEGGNVALIDINAAGLAATKQLAEAHGVKAWTYECNVTDGARVKEVIDQAAEDMGGFDTLCHCAGILRTYHTHEMTFEQWHQIIDINLNGTFYVNQAALPHLLKNRFSALVNCSSTSGIGQPPLDGRLRGLEGRHPLDDPRPLSGVCEARPSSELRRPRRHCHVSAR